MSVSVSCINTTYLLSQTEYSDLFQFFRGTETRKRKTDAYRHVVIQLEYIMKTDMLQSTTEHCSGIRHVFAFPLFLCIFCRLGMDGFINFIE